MTVSLHIFCGQVKIKLSKNRPHRIAYKTRYRTHAYKVSQNQISALRRAINRYGPFFVKNPAVKVYIYNLIVIAFVNFRFLNLLDVQKYISLYGKTTSQNCL